MKRCRDFVGTLLFIGSLLLCFDQANAQPTAPAGVEVGNNIQPIKSAAQAPYEIEWLGKPKQTTTIWEGDLRPATIGGGEDGSGLRKYITAIEDAIRRCNEGALADAKKEALSYLKGVLVYSLHPALEIAQWIRAIQMKCGDKIYDGNWVQVRNEFVVFQGHINEERRKREASIAPVTTPTQTTPPAPTSTEDRQGGFIWPRDGDFRNVAFTASGGVVSRDANATISRLAREVGNVKIHDVSNVNQNDVGAFGEFRARIPIAESPSPSPFCRFIEQLARRGITSGCGSSLDIGYRFTGVDGSSSGAGPQLPNLSFPGLGVEGSAGNNSSPGGYFITNQPHTFGYNYEYRQHMVQMIYSGLLSRDLGPNAAIQPFIGVRGMQTSINDRYSANVTFPGNFTVDSLYTTNTDMMSGGLFGGANFFLRPPDSPFLIIFGARGGFDVNRAESDIAFGIRTPVFNDLQRITVTDTKVTPYFRVEGGIATGFLGGSLQSTLFVEHGGAFPNVQIPGGGPPPNINFTNETSFGGRFAVVLPFPPGNGWFRDITDSRRTDPFTGRPLPSR